MAIKVAIFQTHPIQYFAPMWRQLAREPGLDITVFYLSDSSLRGSLDSGFGRPVTWDVPLLDGYRSVFLKWNTNTARPWDMRLDSPMRLIQQGGFQCTVVLGYTHPFEWQAIWASLRLGLGVAMRGEFGPPRTANPVRAWIRNLALKRLYTHIDAFAVIGSAAKTHLLKHNVLPSRMVSSPYAVDTAIFRRRARSATLRKSLGLERRDKVALFSGKLIPRKSPETLIHALAHLSDLPHVKALILGEGPLGAELKRLAQREAHGRVIFAGFVNQSRLAEYFAQADVLVLPSLSETWGLVVNEAMHMGLPIIASDQVGCVPDLVLAGRTGEIFQARDATQLANHLKNLLMDPKLRRSYSIEAQKIIRGYTPKTAAKGIAEAIRVAVAGKQSRLQSKRVSPLKTGIKK